MSKYVASVARGLKGLDHVSPGLSYLCQECNPENLDEDAYTEQAESAGDEGGYMRCSCEACGSNDGGMRYAAHGWAHDDNDENGVLVHLDICEDCLIYLANGDEPENWR